MRSVSCLALIALVAVVGVQARGFEKFASNSGFNAQQSSARLKAVAKRSAADIARAHAAAGSEVNVDVETALALGVDAEAWARALAQARAGSTDWWDSVKAGLNGVADGVNIAKQWDCKKCTKCTSFALDFQQKLVDALLGQVVGNLATTALCSNFDIATASLCGAVCTPIPVPGLCPVVCPPFIIYAHTRCSAMIDRFMQSVRANAAVAAAAAARSLNVAAIANLPGARVSDICDSLGLCPTTRTDCGADCFRRGHETFVAGDGDCKCTNTITTCGRDGECAISGGCNGECHCVNGAGPNECRCLRPKPVDHQCQMTEPLAGSILDVIPVEFSLPSLDSIIADKWNCYKCSKCRQQTGPLVAAMARFVNSRPVTELNVANFCADFIRQTSQMCTTIAREVPLPGVGNAVCGGFNTFVQQQCATYIDPIVTELKGNAALVNQIRNRALTAADLRSLTRFGDPCTAIGLCPLSGRPSSCGPDCWHRTVSRGNERTFIEATGECERTGFLTCSSGNDATCRPTAGGCNGQCLCWRTTPGNTCKCMKDKPNDYTCASTTELD